MKKISDNLITLDLTVVFLPNPAPWHPLPWPLTELCVYTVSPSYALLTPAPFAFSASQSKLIPFYLCSFRKHASVAVSVLDIICNLQMETAITLMNTDLPVSPASHTCADSPVCPCGPLPYSMLLLTPYGNSGTLVSILVFICKKCMVGLEKWLSE